jgi:UDP-galactopyranose mutase
VVSFDYPVHPEDSLNSEDPQYPIRDERNSNMYSQYLDIAKLNQNVIFGGRLGEYRYYDIDQAIGSAMTKAARHIAGASTLVE